MSSQQPEIDGREFLQTFATLADTLVDDFDLIELLHLLTARAVAYTSADEVGILLTDDTGTLQCLAASNERTRLLELFQIQNEEGPCRDCVTTGSPIEIDDLALGADRWPLFAPQAISVGFRSVRAVPLRLRSRVLGAMNLFSVQPGGIGASGRVLSQAMADVATIGILQQRELFEAQTVAGQLQQALDSRVVIEQAKGVIAEQATVEMDEAFVLLRSYARNHNRTLSAVVSQVVDHTLTASDLVER
jgi:GAF domain-containing protein